MYKQHNFPGAVNCFLDGILSLLDELSASRLMKQENSPTSYDLLLVMP
jgi:hypothetical protein